MNENKEKRTGIKALFSRIKALIFKIFGRARWFLLGFVLLSTPAIMLSFNYSISEYVKGLKYDEERLITETPLADIEDLSVNSHGKAAVSCDIGVDGITSAFDMDTCEVSYIGDQMVTADVWKDDIFYISNYALTDDDILYAVRQNYDDYNNRIIASETIVRFNADHSYIDEVCDIKYDISQNMRDSKLSRLHYYNGSVTFAELNRDYVRLYSIDTRTKALKVSHDYMTDENGTYTVNVIPVDGTFLFLRSDGNVYNTGFDDPLNDLIYHFDMSPADPFFTQAVICGGDIYIFDENKSEKVWCLENGTAREVLDVSDIAGHEDSGIKFLDSYIPQDSGKETLIVCLSDGIFTYSDGSAIQKNIILRPKVGVLFYIFHSFSIISQLCLYGLIINLIIRKKTIFYKQMIATVPVFTILAIVGAVKLYDYFAEQNNENIRNEIEIVCGFSARALTGYDFSGLLEADDNTGAEYRQLLDRLKSINTDHTREWSKDYIFSILYRTDDTNAVALVYDDRLCMPMYTKDKIPSEQEFVSFSGSGDHLVTETINSMISQDSRESEITAYERITDKDGSGKIYLRVRTVNRRFWYQRRQLIFFTILFAAILITVLSAIILLTSLYVTRAIRKATAVVKKISEGDLSARIKYRSKDELGEICTQVNSMGKSLEELFEEKDRSEQFYYKFVPEQFRKLLGKEKFTDLALGDSCSRELTVLFCDIRSFSINSEVMTAKENFEFVNIIYGIAGPIIRQNGGFVDKYIGDAVMALFENADDAVKSGIEIYRAIVLDPLTAERLGISDINIGIGIHSGMARIGIVGESERLSGTVISDTVNLSSRLESLTKQYRTAMLVSKDTVDRMTDPDSLDLRYLGILQVAGVNEVKGVYEVLDCMPDEERAKRHANSRSLREAIRLFHLGRREETLDMLRTLTASGGGDHVTDMYYDFVNSLSDEDKGNVFRFVRK